jgi:hypothetical protein
MRGDKRSNARVLLVVVACCTLPVILLICARLLSGTLQQYSPSPDGARIAQVRVFKNAGATDANIRAVQMKKEFHLFRHTVFEGGDYGATISVRWLDANRLLITCVNCKAFNVFRQETSWDDVAITYDLQ